jgi:hypothetical protein
MKRPEAKQRHPIIYVRLSRDDMRDAAEPIDQKFVKRIAICLNLAHQHGIIVEEQHIYTEQQSRLSIDNRVVLLDCLGQIRTGQVSHLITPYNDRVFGGDLSDVGRIEDALIEGNTTLVTTEKMINFGHEDYLVTDATMVRMKAVMDNHYVQSVIKKRKESNRQKARDGQRYNGFAPYGYQWVPARYQNRTMVEPPHYETVEEEYPIVEEIFQRIRHEGIMLILRDFNERLRATGAPLPPGVARRSDASDQWIHSTLHRILHNPHYAGYPAQRQQIGHKGKRKMLKEGDWIMPADAQPYPHPVTRAEMEEIHARMTERKPNMETKGNRERFLLGVLRCLRGKPMHSNGHGNYNCNCREHGDDHASKYIRAEAIEQGVVQIIRNLVEKPDTAAIQPMERDRAELHRQYIAARDTVMKLEREIEDLMNRSAWFFDNDMEEQYGKLLRKKKAELDTNRSQCKELQLDAHTPEALEPLDALAAIRRVGFPEFWSAASSDVRALMVQIFIASIQPDEPEPPYKRVTHVSVRTQPFIGDLEIRLDLRETSPHYLTARKAAGQTDLHRYSCDCGCGAVVEVTPSHDTGDHHFASSKCWGRWKEKQTPVRMVPCSCGCGADIRVVPSKPLQERYFVNRECYLRWNSNRPK